MAPSQLLVSFSIQVAGRLGEPSNDHGSVDLHSSMAPQSTLNSAYKCYCNPFTNDTLLNLLTA